MSRSPRRNQSSAPKLAADSRAFQVSPARPQPRSSSMSPPSRVDEAVEVGRNVEAEELEVVADVPDDRELSGLEDVGEASREARAAAPSGQQDDLHAGTARSARVRGPSYGSCEALEIHIDVDVEHEFGNGDGRKRRMRPEAIGASRAVERREDARVGQRQRIRRSVGSFNERQTGIRQSAESGRGRRREIGVDDERVAIHPRESRSDRGTHPFSGIGDDFDESGYDCRIIRDHENAADRERRLDDVAEHRDCGGGSKRRGQPTLRVSAIRDHDRRHAAKVTRRSRRTRSCQGRMSPTRGRRTSACRGAPRPRQCPCDRG